MRRRTGAAASALTLACLAALLLPPLPSHSGGTAPVSSYRVVNSFPHDRKAFTQGLAAILSQASCAIFHVSMESIRGDYLVKTSDFIQAVTSPAIIHRVHIGADAI